MTTRAQDREQAERLARAYALEIRREQSVTAALVAAISGVRQPKLAGERDRRTPAEMVAESGAGAVVRLEGKP